MIVTSSPLDGIKGMTYRNNKYDDRTVDDKLDAAVISGAMDRFLRKIKYDFSAADRIAARMEQQDEAEQDRTARYYFDHTRPCKTPGCTGTFFDNPTRKNSGLCRRCAARKREADKRKAAQRKAQGKQI